eukprot:1817907-Pleurochrysis_carterae.AAC.1
MNKKFQLEAAIEKLLNQELGSKEELKLSNAERKRLEEKLIDRMPQRSKPSVPRWLSRQPTAASSR